MAMTASRAAWHGPSGFSLALMRTAPSGMADSALVSCARRCSLSMWNANAAEDACRKVRREKGKTSLRLDMEYPGGLHVTARLFPIMRDFAVRPKTELSVEMWLHSHTRCELRLWLRDAQGCPALRERPA